MMEVIAILVVVGNLAYIGYWIYKKVKHNGT